jgi:prepilin-type N-terminal cleavage/methylation domain-containing protein
LRLLPKQTAFSLLAANTRKRWIRIARDKRGFTLIEIIVVMVLLGVVTTMFSATYTTTVNRSSHVQAQNIAQTEVRAALNRLVSDLRNATTGGTTAPIYSAGASSISFYSPDELAPNSTTGQVTLRMITYSINTSNVLQRQVTNVTSYDSNGNPVYPGNTGTIQRLSTVLTPLTGDPANGGWSAGQMFKYCQQSPPNMAIDPSNATSPELITWSCQTPDVNTSSGRADIKTIVARAVVSPYSNSERFTYGAVATLRWDASS